MRHIALFGFLALGGTSPAIAAPIIFTTETRAIQTVTSPLFGFTPAGDPASVNLVARGPLTFTVDPATGVAAVTSGLKGTDFPTPFGLANYDLYNTSTTGTVTSLANGRYNVEYQLLFELAITSGPLAGIVFETKQNVTFLAANVPLPFEVGTIIGDPNRPNDPVAIFLQADPNGLLGVPVGAPVGFSSNRVLIIDQITSPVPEPLSIVVLGAGLAGIAAYRRRPKPSSSDVTHSISG